LNTLRLFGIGTIVVFVISIGTVSTASAAKITYSGNGRFIASNGIGRLETVGGTQIACGGNTGTGKLGKSPARTAELTLSFSACSLLGKSCHSSGGKAGLIDTNKLLATFGDIATKVKGGALVKPASGTALLVSPVQCGEVSIEVQGSVIGEFTTKLDVQTNSLNLVFALLGKGEEYVTKFAGESQENFLESTIEGATEDAGLELAETLTLAEGSGQLLA
jgi:hypothetical protein